MIIKSTSNGQAFCLASVQLLSYIQKISLFVYIRNDVVYTFYLHSLLLTRIFFFIKLSNIHETFCRVSAARLVSGGTSRSLLVATICSFLFLEGEESLKCGKKIKNLFCLSLQSLYSKRPFKFLFNIKCCLCIKQGDILIGREIRKIKKRLHK